MWKGMIDVIFNALELVKIVLGTIGVLLLMIRLLMIMIPPLIEDSFKLWTEIKATIRLLKEKQDVSNNDKR